MSESCEIWFKIQRKGTFGIEWEGRGIQEAVSQIRFEEINLEKKIWRAWKGNEKRDIKIKE